MLHRAPCPCKKPSIMEQWAAIEPCRVRKEPDKGKLCLHSSCCSEGVAKEQDKLILRHQLLKRVLVLKPLLRLNCRV